MVGSMGRVGTAGDNAAMESFFTLLQKNVVDRRRWGPEKNCASRSSRGSNGLITGAAVRALESIMTARPVRPRDRNCHLIVQ